ncbi:hypothetical protein FLONG3_4100 [Fusarium longipes]|uniref:Uncharacterized protein n=1 Tax=Fusarium longipes TaxID=694270 RepID=A0A395T002_9HYPO|nr:hypothetical protein FLONG3_4100 [Fusarium longipes]
MDGRSYIEDQQPPHDGFPFSDNIQTPRFSRLDFLYVFAQSHEICYLKLDDFRPELVEYLSGIRLNQHPKPDEGKDIPPRELNTRQFARQIQRFYVMSRWGPVRLENADLIEENDLQVAHRVEPSLQYMFWMEGRKYPCHWPKDRQKFFEELNEFRKSAPLLLLPSEGDVLAERVSTGISIE